MEKILAKMEKVRMEKNLVKMEKIIVSIPTTGPLRGRAAAQALSARLGHHCALWLTCLCQ
jgi:hypothetical protein